MFEDPRDFFWSDFQTLWKYCIIILAELYIMNLNAFVHEFDFTRILGCEKACGQNIFSLRSSRVSIVESARESYFTFFASYGAREIWDCQSRLELLHVKSTSKALVLTETLERHDIQ